MASLKRERKINDSESNNLQIKLLIILLITIVLTTIFLIGNKKANIDLKIGEMTIENEQFVQVMNDKKNEVVQYFTKNYNATVDDSFWSQDFSGEVPSEMLYDKTVDELRIIEAEYSLAQEMSYVDLIDYSSFLSRMEIENAIRAERTKNGEAVYGLKEYNKDLYLIFERDIFEKNYTSNDKNPGMEITQSEIDKFYEDNKETMFLKNDSIEFNYIQIYYDLIELSDTQITEFKKDLNEAHQAIISTNQSLSDVVDKNESLKEYFGYEKIDSYELSSKGKYIGDIIDIALKYDAGQTSGVIDQNGSLFLVEVLDHTYYDYLDKKEVEASISKTLREEKYDDLIQQRTESRSPQGDRDKNIKFVLSLLK